MRRRIFLRNTAVVPFGGALGLLSGDVSEARAEAAAPESKPDALIFIGDMRLPELRDELKKELLEDVVPAWYRCGIDDEYGGIYYPIDRDGTVPSTNKGGWYQGRALWTFSRLYNRHDKDDRHLETARKLWRFMKEHAWDNSSDFYFTMTREGKPLPGNKDIFSDIYGAYGMIEYFRASRDTEAFARARAVILRITERILAPTFQYRPGYEPGTNTLGIWLHFLPVLTQYLTDMPIDKEIIGIKRLAVRRILHHHVDWERKVVYELIDGATLEPFPEPENRWNWVCHTTQCAWMLMDEAVRTGDTVLFGKAGELLKWMINAGWDGEYSGMADTVYWDAPEMTTWDKSMWGHCETLLALQSYIEHTLDPWAVQWYAIMRLYSYEVFPDRQYGNWFVSLERSGAHKPDTPNMEVFHRPRSLMLAIESLDRMIARGGKASEFLE